MRITDQAGTIIVNQLSILKESDDDRKVKIRKLFILLEMIFEELTSGSTLEFPTLFSRIVFVFHQQDLPRSLKSAVHDFRMNAPRSGEDYYFGLGCYSIANLCMEFSDITVTTLDRWTESFKPRVVKRSPNEEYIGNIKGMVVERDDNGKFLFIVEKDPEASFVLDLSTPLKDGTLDDSLVKYETHLGLPVSLMLIDVVLKDATLSPKAYVLQPDYLVDVTAIAERFKPEGIFSQGHILSRFLPKISTKYLIIGNIANTILDDLILDDSIALNEILKNAFQNYPLALAILSDEETADIFAIIKKHYYNLQRFVKHGLKELSINPKNVFLESAFYSPDYGLQGRLDLLHIDDSENTADIIELKSGKPFRPNAYGISISHYVQTLLYDLIVKSAYGKSFRPANYILYSILPEKSVKFAPAIQAQQYQAIYVRNKMIIYEWMLSKDDNEGGIDMMSWLDERNFPDLSGFIRRDLLLFRETYTSLDNLEQLYFKSLASFISKEHKMSKLGSHGISTSNGHAALWLEGSGEKEERFSIVSHLRIDKLGLDNDPSLISLLKTDKTSELNNFRRGDIMVFYPLKESPVFRDQVFKASLIDQSKDQLTIRLRGKKYREDFFSKHDFWCLEPDLFDSSFRHGYQSIFTWAGASQSCRDLILTRKAPAEYAVGDNQYAGLTSEQERLLNEMISCQDYYLLWGPPGTGKTSIMMKHYVQHVHENSNENILVLAYTNKAVDEICQAIESIDDTYRDRYVRIGSRYSVDSRYVDNLLQNRVSEMSRRSEIVKMLGQCRIVISTIASVQGRSELFDLKSFDSIVVDEASQILEHSIIGLLSRVPKWILIGDHRQLPAVVQQSHASSEVTNEELVALGLDDRRNSLFERMYLRCEDNEWTWAHGNLSQQGRMHVDLMDFVSNRFYRNGLNVLEGIDRLTSPLHMDSSHVLDRSRMIFISTKAEEDLNWKRNRFEAEKVIEVLRHFKAHRSTETEIGVITPFRSQIALIKSKLQDQGNDDDSITVDTVERYQGGARDIIIISLCTNRISQLRAISSISTDGIDRKLNVALTRAREQIVIIGNEEILRKSDIYASLIDYCRSIEKKSE